MEKRKKILIVDDERFNINVLVDLLKPNYKIMAAINGKQALKAAQSDSPPDLILLDIMMPEMDGYEVCQQLKADEKTHKIPVIFVTAMGQESDETKGLEIGAVDYITKPISPAIVEARVKVQIESKEAEEAIAAAHARMQLLKKIAVAANEASAIEDALQICLDEVCSLTGWPVGHAYMLAAGDVGMLIPTKLWHLDQPRKFKIFKKVTEETRFTTGIGLPGRVLSSGKPAWIIDVTKDTNFPRAKYAENIGVKAAFCFPVLVGNKVAAVLEFFTPETVEPDEQLLEVMANVGTQLGRVIERIQAEEAIASANARINHVLASSPAVLYSFEATGNYAPTFISENVQEVFGYEPREYLEDRNFVPDRIHPDDAARIGSDLSHLFKEGHLINEYRFRHKDGNYRWVSDELRVNYDDAGKPVEIFGSWSDISARKQVKEKIVSLLKATSLFVSLDETALRDIAAQANSLQLMGGMQLIQEGDLADSFYLVMSGRIRTYVTQDDGNERQTGEVGRGELVGETAVLTGEPQPESARAIRDSDLLQFSKEAFYRLAESYPKAVLLFSKNIAIRYQREVHGINADSAISTIAIIPAGHGAPLSDFTNRLVASLSEFGSTIHLDVNSVGQALGQESAHSLDEDSILRWLNMQEAKHQFVIYESTLEPSSWSRRCIRLADRILSVGSAGYNPDLNSIENEIASQQTDRAIARQELVLLHPNRDKFPSGTGKWLDLRNVANHHHIVFDNTDDYKRLCRFLTGNAISLVLGGGGARGCAHIGLIRALQELHVPIDTIGGTSIGSALSGFFALGLNSYEILAKIDKLHMERPMKDYTLPMVSLITGRRLNKSLQKMYGDIQIEDLWVNYFSVSANLTRAQTEIHKQGSVWKCVRASMSIPGHIPPMVFNGELHVDGGVLNNLPVDKMREICDGIIIANNVSPRVELKVTGSNEGTYSGWDYMLNALKPSSKKLQMPSIVNILMRSGTLYSIKQISVSKAMADIYMSPPIEKFQLLDFGSSHEIEEVGYKYAFEVLNSQLHDNELLKRALVN